MSILEGATAPLPQTDVVHGRVLSVKEFIPSSELTLAATVGGQLLTVSDTEIFAEEGGSAIITEFEATSPTETINYVTVDDDLLQISLASGLTNNYSAGALIQRTPLILDKEAHVMRDDSEDEVIIARVPHRLYDALADGIRDEGEWEAVVVRFDGAEWVVDDILGQQPAISGAYLDPEDIPTSDGIPPASSPTPTVQGGVGFLMARWTPIANADTVSYEVHLSDTSGFTPDASTQAAVIDGSIVFLRQQASGHPLHYGVDYYVKIIARDRDGAAAAGAEGTDQLNPAGETDILAGSVTAEHLASVILLSSLIQTASEGQRVEIDVQGMRLYNSLGEIMVDMPTDPTKQPRFAGEIEAGGLDVTGDFIFRGTDNRFDQDSVSVLQSHLANPSVKPSLLIDWDKTAFDITPWHTAGHSISSYGGFAYTASGGESGAVPCFYLAFRDNTIAAALIIEVRASDLVILRSWTYDSNNVGVRGLAANGDQLWLCVEQVANPASVRIVRFDLSTVGSPAIVGQPTDIAVNEGATIGHDGTNLLLVDFNGTTGNQPARIRKRNDSSPFANVSTHATTGRSFSTTNSSTGGRGRFTGIVVVGTDYWLSTNDPVDALGSRVHKYNSSFAYQSNNDFKIDTTILGLAYDGTRFWTKRNSAMIYKHSTWVWTTESATYWVAYTWRDDVGGFETLPSPMASVNMTDYRRAKLRITHPMMPMGVDMHRHWVERSATQPATTALNYQAEPSFATSEMDMPSFLIDYDPSGAAPPTTNNFEAGMPAMIRSGDMEWEQRGDGQLRGVVATGFAHRKNMSIQEEFFGLFNVSQVATGTGAGSAASDIAGHPGVHTLETGTTASGVNGFRTTTGTGIRIETTYERICYVCNVRTGTLSDGTNRYFLGAGLVEGVNGSLDEVTAALIGNACFFQFKDDLSDGVANGRWRLVRSDGTTLSVGASGVAVAGSTWYRLEFIIYPNENVTEWYINGVLVNTTAATLTAGPVLPAVGILKTVGTANRSAFVDFMSVEAQFAGVR